MSQVVVFLPGLVRGELLPADPALAAVTKVGCRPGNALVWLSHRRTTQNLRVFLFVANQGLLRGEFGAAKVTVVRDLVRRSHVTVERLLVGGLLVALRALQTMESINRLTQMLKESFLLESSP